MGASITIDINAKVQGYQAAIEKMKAEFAKIDPGSDIGKKLAKALSAADNQVKNLSRNLFPKASSDTQIDAIIDKVNRVGESVLQVSQLMQSVGTTDLNFSALGSDVEELRSKIASLQSDLESKLGQGILEAAKSSEQLRSVLEGILGIDLDKISGKDLFSAVEKGALKAAKEVENANAAVQKAQDNINASKTKVSNLENGLLGTFASKENMQQQVRELESQYTDAVSGLRDKISSALAQKFAEGGNFNSEELLNSFFQGLTPETLESKIKELFSALSNAGVYKEKGDLQNFYQDFFGEFKNINQVIKNIDLSALEAVMTKFKELIQATKGEIGSANEQSITSLINTGMIEQAGKETSAAFTKAFRLIRNTIDAEQKKTVEKLEPQYQAALQQQADAIQRQTAVDTARTDLNTEVTQLREQLSKQQEEITRLREQLNQLAKGKLTSLKTSGGIAGGEAAENMFPSGAAQKYQEQLHRVEAAEQAIGKIKGVSQRWFSIYAVVRMVTNAIKKAIATIKELDDTITEIAIVTNMTQSELWGQMSSYSALADKYAASISGVYKVSQLYYQQGLQQAEVMELTEQTLKMARISGLDYAEATDYMTNAVRSFKMEMSEAQTVVDVYSAVAASSATSVTELASAMSKTASSAQAVGSSFQNTTAMLAVMIEATRESPENIGSAMKSIISRYGELKENKTGIDSEGEEYSLNKVDKALQSIGISIHDVNGEFKDFDDVIFELASKWDTVDKNTQRYIATVMAGNRQQSRFLALVSSGQRLQEMSSTAENSEDAAQLQYLKVLDSITAKTQNLQNALQSLYLNSGFEQLNKDLLDFGTGIIKVFSSMNQWAGKPIPAILAIGSTFYNVANIATAAFQLLSTRLHARAEILKGMITRTSQQGVNERYVLLQDENERIIAAWDKREQQFITHQERLNEIAREGADARADMEESGGGEAAPTGKWGKVKNFLGNSKVKMGVSLGASALSLITTGLASGAQQRGDKQAAGGWGIASSALSGLAMGSAFGPWGMAIGSLAGGVMGLFQNWGNLFQSAEEKLKDLQEKAEEANNEFLQKKSEATDFNKQIKQLEELEKHRYDSAEAEEAYYEAANKMGETYPELINGMDEAGNVTIDLANAMDLLSEKGEEATKSARKAATANYNAANQGVEVAENQEKTNVDTVLQSVVQEIHTSVIRARTKEYLIQKEGISNPTEEQITDFFKNIDPSSSREAYAYILDKPQYTGVYNDGDWSSFVPDEMRMDFYAGETRFFDDAWNVINGMIDYLENFNNNLNPKLQEVAKEIVSTRRYSDEVLEYLSNTDTSNFGIEEQFLFNLLKRGADLSTGARAKVANKEEVRKSTARSGIAQIIGSSLIGHDMSFQTGMVNASSVLAQAAMNQLYGNNKTITENAYKEFVGEENKEGTLETKVLPELTEQLEGIWSKLTSSKQQEYNDLLKNASRYSSAQLKNELTKFGFGVNDTLTQAIVDDAQSKLYDIEKFQQKFDDRVTQRDKAGKTFFNSIFNALSADNAFGSVIEEWGFGSAELEAMADLQDEIDNYVDNGKMSIESAEGFVNAYAAILEQLPQDSELREKAQKLIFDNKDWSITGLYQLADVMANIGIDGDVLQQVRGLSNYVPKNLVADLDSFTNSITSKFEDFQKALKNASDGMDLKDALKFVDKLGMSLNDLDFKNGKFYTKHDFKPEDIEKAYLNWNNELYQQLEKDYNSLAGKNGILQGVYDTEGNKTLDVLKNIINQTKNWDSLDTIEDRVSAIKEAGSLSELEDKEIISVINLYDQYYKAWEDQSVTENGEKSFNAYVLNQLTQSYENAQAALQTASEYEVNSFLLRNGGIEAFVKQVGRQETDDNGEIIRQGLSESQKERLTAAIRTGDLTSLQDDELLWSYVRQYVDVVGDAFKDIQKQLGEALLASFEDGGPKTIEVTKENLEVIKAYKELFSKINGEVLEPDQEVKEGDILTFQDIETFKKDNALFNNHILAISNTQKDALENLQKYHKALYGTKFKDISNLLDETTSIGYDEFTNYLASIGKLFTTDDNGKKIFSESELAEYGVKISELTGDFIITDLNKYISKLEADLGALNDSNSSVQERNEIKAKIASARSQQVVSQKKATEDILKSYDSISIEQREAFANAFKVDFDADTLNKIFKDNYDGTSKLDVNELQKYLREKGNTISSATRNYLNELIAKIADDYLAKIETAASYIIKGTTKQEDMAKIVSEFNDRYNAGATISSLFKWDDILEAFTFKPEYLQYYIQMQREELAKAGFNDNQIEAYINNQIKQITNAVDITGFYGSENRGIDSKSRQTLRNQISAALFANAKFQPENAQDYAKQAEQEGFYGLDNQEQAHKLARLAQQDNATKKQQLQQQTTDLLTAIESGGQIAIEAMKTLYQGQELSAEQVEAAYRAQLNNFSNAFDAIEGLSINSVVDQNTREILNQIDGFVVSSDGVVLAVGNMLDAYNQLYENMKRTAVATTAELNNAYAKYLTAQDQKEIDAIEAISNASGMTYEAFGNMLTQYGFSLEQAIKNQAALGIEQTGTGKIRITDFTKLAAAMGWEPNSEEYTDALKSYNDYLIEFNTKTKDAIKNEFESLTTAKGGDWLNLTNLFKEIGDELTPEIKKQLLQAGAVFSDGILKTTTNANFLEIAKILSDAAINAGQELSNEFKDMIESIIKAYSDSIIKGIKGNLTNVEAGNLINQAKNLGIELDESSFIKTEEGLKLAQDKAIELYYALQRVDAIQAHLVFKELNDSLEKSNEHYKSIATIQAHIVELQNKITEADAKTNPARKKQYEEELKLAKEIAQVRLTTEDSSFDFMSTPLNGALKNAPTYWEAWAKAVSVVEDANKNKYMGWEDFAHLIQGVQDLAVQTGKDMEFMGVTFNKQGTTAGELIEQGYSALKVDPESKQTVLDLNKLMTATGLQFSQGADGFSADVQAGIREYAQGQVDMLDGMIQMLETVVAMEKLGDIAGEDGDNEIEISDILPKFNFDSDTQTDVQEFGQKYSEIIQELQNLLTTNKNFAKGAKQFKINGTSFEEIIGMSPEKLASQGENFLKAYVAAIKAFTEAGGDWDTAFDLLQEKLLSLNLADGTEFEFGGITYYYKDNIALEKKGEKFVVNGQEYNNSDDAIQALKTNEALKALKLAPIKTTTGEDGALDLTFGEDLHVKLTYNGDVGYTATITGGPEITSNTKEGINLGILSWAKNQEIPIDDTTIPADEKVIKFTIDNVTYSIDTKGEVTLEGNESKYHLKDSIEQAYQESIPKEVEIETATDMTVNVSTAVEDIKKKIEDLNTTLGTPQEVQVDTTTATEAIGSLQASWDNWIPKSKTVTIDTKETASQTSGIKKDSNTNIRKDLAIKPSVLSSTPKATGTIGLAKAQGTLMGELGPELYVQNGRYFVAGQNGPEFVNLAPDAIVFNHLQTRSLFDKGMSPGRGKAVTNERNAISYAKGNVNGGPAMASAASALAELKKLRAQWQALAGMSVADLAGKGGGGGGGGEKDLPGFIRDVERWYNWLQKIADLEKQITYQEQLRSKIQSDMVPSGKAYYASLQQTYEDAKDSALTSQSLFLSQKETFNKRREQLNNSPLSELYTFDETGQLHYQEGSFNWLAQLFKTDDFGQLALSPQQQYEMILQRNPEFAQYMKYNSEGKEIKQEDYQDNKDQYYLDMVKAFSDRMDAEKEEMQNLFDSWNDQQKAVLEQMQKMNEQLQAMKDNQKEVEESVLKAIVESRERQIKEMEDTKNALQKTNQDFIDGLSKQLDKEQKMYQNNEKDQELQRNRRQLAILQRSGGSASQISSLQKQIEQQSRDQYFEKQQEQIDAVKEASDLQIERLDHQIEIEQEALEYQKANGLLWSEVYNVMKETPEQITNFIASNTADFWSKSPLTKTEDANELIFKAEQWTQFRDDEKMQKAAMGRIDQNLEIFLAALEQIYGDQANWEEIKAKATEDYNKYYGIDNNDPNKAAWDSYPGKNDIETKNTGKQTTGAASIATDTNDKNKYNNDNEVNPATIYASWSYDEKTHWKKAKTYSGKDIKVLEAKHTFPGAITNGSKCSVCGYKLSYYSPISNTTTDNKVEETKINTTVDTNTNTINKTKQKNNSTPTNNILNKKKLLMYDALNQAANGAIVDQSGAAIIHDNEVILTAEQTRFLRDNILSNKSTSLLGILSSLHSSYKDISANTINSSEGNVIIENATVQMNVQKIADDYDARRAGDQAMEEMLRIARKSGTRSV